eukprot:gi/632958550/ref/XP_007895100.1/ PREDICTED: latent-transforming growth factor beta-binding protein 1-like [Callorhinchus milii]
MGWIILTLYGSFYCTCPHGFTGNGTECWDTDECTLGNLTVSCNDFAACKNTKGSFYCECYTGFQGDEYSCIDTDECEKPSACAENAECNNTLGSYTCTCQEGFVDADGLCWDIDECQNRTDCHWNANCTNTQGSFYCSCEPGFTGNGTDCVDENECAPDASVCHDNATCNNTIGGYQCECREGFEGNGIVCYDINECVQNNTMCHGSYQCLCDLGFTGDGHNCRDIDECLSNTICQDHCVNTLGSYLCSCEKGFIGDGQMCTDIDECQIDNGGCHVEASCVNTIQGFYCLCNNGFTGTGHSCTDINECAFSDNGLIQFQSFQSNEKYSYPNPFKDGFQGNESGPMLAVFWDDADLTEYSGSKNEDVYSQVIVNRTTAEVNKYLANDTHGTFEPKWILKITWDNISPVYFQKINLNETNTFQCTLTTDGKLSFALLKYGTMLWQPNQRLFHRAMMGYTNGKGVFYNEPQTQKNDTYGLGGRYRPDQSAGNTGLPGQWAFRLDKRNTDREYTVYRQMCWQWYLNQPDPSAWNTGMLSCPCDLSQAIEDNRFVREVMPATQPGQVSALRRLQAEGTVFQPALPNRFTAGRRCTYSSEGYLITGLTDRYFIYSSEATTVRDHISEYPPLENVIFAIRRRI